MSSNSYNNTMIGEGIMLDNAAMNPNWHDWNHVFFRYCSSDNWAGDAEQFCDASNDPTCPTDPSLRWKDGDSIQFRGRRILQAAIQELQRTSLPYVGTQERRMPDLDDANYVLFSGSSSGSIGMRTNLDWVANHLRSQNPNLTIRGVSDSAFTFSRSATITPTGCDFATPTSFPVYDFFGAPFVDETCAAGAAAAGDPIQVCSNLQYMLGCNSTKTNYYETPFFVQMDISDANAMGSMGYQRQDPAQLAEFRQKQLDFLFDTIDKTSRDWAPLGVDGIGLFSINIGSHTALMADDKFFGGPSRWRINGQTYSETLYNWLTDGNLKHCVSLGTTGCF
jgi:hypothetical protein